MLTVTVVLHVYTIVSLSPGWLSKLAHCLSSKHAAEHL